MQSALRRTAATANVAVTRLATRPALVVGQNSAVAARAFTTSTRVAEEKKSGSLLQVGEAGQKERA